VDFSVIRNQWLTQSINAPDVLIEQEIVAYVSVKNPEERTGDFMKADNSL